MLALDIHVYSKDFTNLLVITSAHSRLLYDDILVHGFQQKRINYLFSSLPL